MDSSSKSRIRDALTFDDLLLEPLASEVVPSQVSLKTTLVPGIELNIPLLSSAMDTVTETEMAIRMAQEGGIGIIHKNLTPEAQTRMVESVKKYSRAMVINPVTVEPDQTIGQARRIMDEYHISGLPVVRGRKLVGILTNRDLRFEENSELKISEAMTKENLITVPENADLKTSKALLHKNRIEKLLVVDSDFNLVGLVTVKDIQKMERYPNASVDKNRSLLVGAAVGVGSDLEERADRLAKIGVDVLVVDSAHGHSRKVLDAIRWLKKRFSGPVIGGNVATSEGAEALISAGADTVKVGIGPGSICTTRCVSGAGVPQMTAIMDCAAVAKKRGVPIIADGGIKYSGDIVKALAGGASMVMIGALFAGTDEAPGELVLYQGRSYKEHRGMGSIEAMKAGSRDRYFQEGQEKLVAEGIVGRVSYKGPLTNVILQLCGGVRAGMGYCGCPTIADLQTKTRFVKITNAGLAESHVHSVVITKEAPNYYRE